MPIIKTTSPIEAYRIRAKAKNINELTGRTGRPDLTKYIAQQIYEKLKINKTTVLVDVGCGDGSLLIKLEKSKLKNFKGKFIGILPTNEEVSRVKKYLKNIYDKNNTSILIKEGLAEKTALPNNYTDIIICNSVFNVSGNRKKNVKMALSEFYRISKKGGIIFIGELPDKDENKKKNYEDSILNWLTWVLKNEGFLSFIKRFKQVILSLLTSEPLVIVPKKNIFFMKPKNFIQELNEQGIKTKKYYRHKEIDKNGREYISKTRWIYICIKK